MAQNVIRWANDSQIQRQLQASVAGREEIIRILGFILLHIPLAFAMRFAEQLATLHALAALGAGLYWWRQERSPAKVIYVMAYIVGAEVLWRAAGAGVFWEFAKYSLVLLAALLVVKYNLLSRMDKTMVLYFVLLLPSVFLVPGLDRGAISLNLSGPLALAVLTMVFGAARLKKSHLRQMLIALVAPPVGMAALALSDIVVAGGMIVYNEDITSLGMGANQVSAALGLGAFAAFLFIVIERRSRLLQVAMAFLAVWLLGQAAVTFSRGGVWNTVLGIVVAGLFLFRERRVRTIFLSAGTALSLVFYFLVFPVLDTAANSALQARFESLESTGRDKIVQADLEVFLENPMLGVGPNQSVGYHARTFQRSQAHTEYSRLLSEHGILGLGALILLAHESWKRLVSRQRAESQAYRLSFTAWALFYMLHSATRMAAPSFLFGLGAATFLPDEEDSG